MRIQIRVPDPAFVLIADPDPIPMRIQIQFQIQGFDDQKAEKIDKWKFLNIFLSWENCIIFIVLGAANV
jgi:hypothetical protein